MAFPRLFSFVRHYYAEPLIVDRAEGCRIFDEAGRAWLDGYAAVASISVGHSHPRVLDRVIAQARKINHTTMIYQTRPLLDYLEHLQQKLPENLCRHFFVNSGSEAVDFATQACRAHRQKPLIVAFSEGFHGGSFLTKSLTGLPAWQPAFGADGNVHFHPLTWCRDCPESSFDPARKRLSPLTGDCSGNCLEPLAQWLDTHGGETAGALIEPILGVGGIIVPLQGFYRRLQQMCDAFSLDLICDEVQTGFGRCGSRLFGFERLGLQPTVLAMGKGIANGFPMGMVSATEEISQAMSGKLHFSTFGGNPVSCTAADETLHILEEEHLPDNAERVGNLLLELLTDGFKDFSPCREIRGLGLILGIEFSTPELTRDILDRCYRAGLLLGIGGRDRNVIRLEPPLCFTPADAEQAAATLLQAARDSVTV